MQLNGRTGRDGAGPGGVRSCRECDVNSTRNKRLNACLLTTWGLRAQLDKTGKEVRKMKTKSGVV